ncbi:amino acid ABC transporter permease [Deltaproteobacteria bacterium OttesenSCG-928-K17]|nr:amino acid ABC transporter permease [Deltaproteobacteria bacterium OttesenSCG-928-K17]
MADPFYGELFRELTAGFWLSLKIIVPSALIGLGLGIVVGAVRGTGYPHFLVRPFNMYVSLFRGTALIVQIFVIYFGLPDLAMWLRPIFEDHGWPPLWRVFYLTPYQASVVTFALCSGAYHSEYIRGAILSIKKGQFQAAKALGFTVGQTFRAVVIPQAVRRAWPGCGNEIIYLIKYSSLAFIVSAKELTGAATSVANSTFRFTETFFVAGLYYLALVTLATWIFHRVEKSWSVSGAAR